MYSRIAFVGPTFLDTTVHTYDAKMGESNHAFALTKKYGGIMNCRTPFRNHCNDRVFITGVDEVLDQELKNVDNTHESMAEAVIIHDKENTSFVNWRGAETMMFPEFQVRRFGPSWLHIAYLDRLPNVIEYLKDNPLPCTVSVDLVNNEISGVDITQCLHNVDWVVAGEEIEPYGLEHLGKMCKQGVVQHQGKDVKVSSGRGVEEYDSTMVEGKSYVGAGDVFASLFAIHQGDIMKTMHDMAVNYEVYRP